jgi:uncharacterized membrane protein
MATAIGLPSVRVVSIGAPFRWLAGGLADIARAPGPALGYGLGVALLSFGLCWAIYVTNAAFWTLALSAGFVLVAPMLAMGIYDCSRRLEAGERPRLGRMLLAAAAMRGDIAYLGVALSIIYMVWGQAAQIVYGLSTFELHRTWSDFAAFAIGSGEGHVMLASGGLVGGAIAFLTYCLVVVSAPMLLDRQTSVFAADATSLRAGNASFAPLLLWAAIIALLIAASAATGFLALTVVFPWLGFASWRAYRDLVGEPSAPRASAAAVAC